MPGEGRTGANAGFVLVAVLAVTAFLALILGASSLLARGAVQTSFVETAALREEALVSAGVEIAGHQLFGLRLPAGAIDGQQIRLDDGTVTIFASAETGRVDLNGADETLLAAAYTAAGLSALAPEAFAARIAAWREARAFGAEGPGRALAFRSSGDLAFVEGMDAGEIAALAPFVTVFNPGGRIDPLAASRPLLAALPGLSPEAVDEVMRLPETGGTDDLFVLRSVFRGLEVHLLLGERARAYAVRIEARLGRDRPARIARAILVAPLVSTRAYHVADWLDGAAD